MVKIDFRKRKTQILGLSFLFLIVLSVCYFLFCQKAFKKQEVIEDQESFHAKDIVTESVAVPEEDEPEEFYVPPDLPKVITIPAIAVRGYIQSVSIDQEGLIAVPTNVHLVGWYINSVKPGEVGLSIMDGHRDGATIGGIFRNLERLKKGDRISIEFGDGSVKDFEVVDLETLSVEDAYDFMYSRIEGVDIQLNLVTCGGKWIKETKTYEDRIIVRAKGV